MYIHTEREGERKVTILTGIQTSCGGIQTNSSRPGLGYDSTTSVTKGVR